MDRITITALSRHTQGNSFCYLREFYLSCGIFPLKDMKVQSCPLLSWRPHVAMAGPEACCRLGKARAPVPWPGRAVLVRAFRRDRSLPPWSLSWAQHELQLLTPAGFLNNETFLPGLCEETSCEICFPFLFFHL